MASETEHYLRSAFSVLPTPDAEATERARRAVLRAASGRPRARQRRFRPTMPSTRRYRYVIGVAATASLLVVAMLGLASHSFDSHEASPRTRSHHLSSRTGGLLPPFSVSQPLLGSHVVSQAAAAAALSVPQLPLPSASVVGNVAVGSVTEAQDKPDSGAVVTYVAVSYPGADLVVEYESPVPYADPAQYYSTYVNPTPSNLHGFASVGSVAGGPALVLQENKDSTGSNPASVEFVHDGMKIAVIGYRSATSLLNVAESVASE
jgi:hypothetical protein